MSEKQEHPGAYLAREVIAPTKLSVTDAANYLGVTRQALSRLLNGGSSLSPEMALRFEKTFGVRLETLLKMQLEYDIVQIRKQSEKIRVKPYKKAD